MKDIKNSFFTDENFDIQDPVIGHFERFERKLNFVEKKEKISWKWMSIAASVILMIGFWFGNLQKNGQNGSLASISPEMEEVQNYFVNTIHQELKTLEKNRTLNTEIFIEQALEEIEELEDSFKLFVSELQNNGQQKRIINVMIENYQQRLQILENVLKHLETLKKSKINSNEII